MEELVRKLPLSAPCAPTRNSAAAWDKQGWVGAERTAGQGPAQPVTVIALYAEEAVLLVSLLEKGY